MSEKKEVTYKQVEARLYAYKREKAVLDNLKLQVESLSAEPLSCSGNFEERVQTCGIANEPEGAMIRCENEIEELNREIKPLEAKLKTLDNAKNALPPDTIHVIDEYYLNSKPWWKVSHAVNYSPSHCRRIRTKGIEEMVVILNKMSAK